MGASCFRPDMSGSPVARRVKSRQPGGRDYVPRAELLEDRWAPAVLTVTSLADSGAGTLRALIQSSVTRTGGATGNDTIRFAGSLDGGTIGLTTSNNSNSVAGPTAFLVSNSTTIVIDGETGLTKGLTITRSSGAAFRIFQIYPGCNVTLEGLTLSNGGGRRPQVAGTPAPAAGPAWCAIYSQGTLNIRTAR